MHWHADTVVGSTTVWTCGLDDERRKRAGGRGSSGSKYEYLCIFSRCFRGRLGRCGTRYSNVMGVSLRSGSGQKDEWQRRVKSLLCVAVMACHQRQQIRGCEESLVEKSKEGWS